MLSNVKKTINGYKKAQSDEKELGSQLKVLKAVYNLWHLNSLLELDNIYKAQILAFLALGYKALGLDRDALVFANNYLTLHTEIVANKLPSKDLNMLQELETQIKALVRSCSRRRFDLSVRTIGVDLFIHIKSFIDYLQAEIASLKELGSDSDKQAAKFNHLIKLLKSNATCTLSLAPSGKLLISLNNESDDVELATLYAAFISAVNSYGKELTEVVTFVVLAQAHGQGQAQQHATKEQALAYAIALLKSNELICPTFLQDDKCWNNNSRNLNLEPLQEESLAQVKSEPTSAPSTDLIKDESDTATATAAEAPVIATSEVMPVNTTAQVTEPTVETAEQSTLASTHDLAAIAANSEEPATSNDANDVKEANNTSAPMTSSNDAAITIDAKSQGPRVEELSLSYSYTAVVTANSRTNTQDSASSQSQNQANDQAQAHAQDQSQSPIAISNAQDNAQAIELAVVQDKESTSESSINLSSPEGNEICSQESSESNSNHATNTQSEPESICASESELAPKSEVSPAPEPEIESVPAQLATATATATASAVEAQLVPDTDTKAKPKVETTTALEHEHEPVVSTTPEAEAKAEVEAKATPESNHSASEQDSTQSSFDKESTATPANTAPALETKEQIATSNHELASEPQPVAKKVIKPSPIIASNAYQSKEQQKAKGGLFGFIRRIFGGK